MGSEGDVALLQFAREPQPGRVKTRLFSELSPQQACALHSELVLWTNRQLLRSGLGDVMLHIAGSGGHAVFQQCLENGAKGLVLQRGEDLGARMLYALSDTLRHYRRVILVGSDCPEIDATYLQLALEALDNAQVVLGPAADGGFVLIGATCVQADMFDGVQWGTGSVLEQTVSNLGALAIPRRTLPVLRDIDRPEDLAVWEQVRAGDSLPSRDDAIP